MPPAAALQHPPIVCIRFSDLADVRSELQDDLTRAFGADGLGLLLVSGVPEFPALRRTLLVLAPRLAALPIEVLSQLEDAASSYNVGWSHGKEALVDGRPDTQKGSFYANPCHEAPAAGDVRLQEAWPEYFRPNVWPAQELPQLQPAFMRLGRCIHDVGLALARHCDKYIAMRHTAPHNSIPAPASVAAVLGGSRNHKARLLHYFPPSEHTHGQGDRNAPAWCGWHTDHGSLTGLTSALYMDVAGNEVPCPDPEAGLYARDRAGNVVKISIPPDCLAFQVGEALQVHSGGLLRATPHYVRACAGAAAAGISRSTYALFMQPDVTFPMDAPPGVSEDIVSVGCWQRNATFGTFARDTLQHYYKPPPQAGRPGLVA